MTRLHRARGSSVEIGGDDMKRALRMLTGLEQEGQSMVEYALILVLVAVVVVTVLTTLGTRITAVFTNVANALGK